MELLDEARFTTAITTSNDKVFTIKRYFNRLSSVGEFER